MSKERAVIEAELAGAAKVEADAKKINRALGDTKKAAGEELAAGINKSTAGLQVFGAKADALKGLLSPQALLGGVVGGAVLASIKSVTDYLGVAAGKAREFEDKTSGAARRSGADLAGLRQAVNRNTTDTLQGVDAQLEYVDAVQQTSYGGKGAAAALKTVGDVATMLGRKDADFAAVTAAMMKMQGVGVDVGAQLKGMVGLASEFKTVGGPAALLDGIAQLRGALAQLTPEAAEKIKVLQATLQGQGMTPEAAAGRAGGLAGLVKARWMDIERNLGHKVLSPSGEAADPVQTTKELRALVDRKYGTKDTVARRFATLSEFGPELGSLILGTDFKAIEQASTPEAVAARQKAAEAEIARKKAAHLASPEGQRELQRQRDEQIQREVGGGVANVGDWYERTKTNVLGGILAMTVGTTGSLNQPAKDAAATTTPTVHLSPESTEAIGKSAASALKANPPKIEIPVNPNAPGGN